MKLILLFVISLLAVNADVLPVFIATWPFGKLAVDRGHELFTVHNKSLMDSVMYGISDMCEIGRCAGSVGGFGSFDENGYPSLDGMMMRGSDLRIGAVGNVKSVRTVIQVARAVMDYTTHTFMAGSDLDQFASDMGLNVTNLTNSATWRQHETWRNRNCQGNYRVNVLPDPKRNCGPYRPDPAYTSQSTAINNQKPGDDEIKDGDGDWSHDTIGLIGVDKNNKIVVGTSTNGAGNKVPGRIGDTPMPGAGSYADDDVGACAATGDGDVMLRFLPCYQAVESMRMMNMNPGQAADYAMYRIAKKVSSFSGALITVNSKGEYGAGCYGLRDFRYSVKTGEMENSTRPVKTCITMETYVPPRPPTVCITPTWSCGHGSINTYSMFTVIVVAITNVLQ